MKKFLFPLALFAAFPLIGHAGVPVPSTIVLICCSFGAVLLYGKRLRS